jgi:Fanconi anemia group M protein
MCKFKAGGYNTLISTCVGEEGLDIGEVDLIVCFDAHKSPVRLVQRMGRTGRQREGRIVMLVTEGKEHAVRVVNMGSKNHQFVSPFCILAVKTLQLFHLSEIQNVEIVSSFSLSQVWAVEIVHLFHF